MVAPKAALAKLLGRKARPLNWSGFPITVNQGFWDGVVPDPEPPPMFVLCVWTRDGAVHVEADADGRFAMPPGVREGDHYAISQRSARDGWQHHAPMARGRVYTPGN